MSENVVAEENIGPEKWHGTTGGTTNHGCKCLACRKVWTEYNIKRRKERTALIQPNDARHGRYTFYANHGCRCEPCTKAHREVLYERMARRKARTA